MKKILDDDILIIMPSNKSFPIILNNKKLFILSNSKKGYFCSKISPKHLNVFHYIVGIFSYLLFNKYLFFQLVNHDEIISEKFIILDPQLGDLCN